MVCPCIPPPPVFDLPPPPDPSLIWHLISDSDEPVEQLQQVQQCDAQLGEAFNLIAWFLTGSFLDYLPYFAIAICVVLSILLIVILIFIRTRRPKTKADLRKRSNECAGDIILNGNHHLSYDDANADGKKSVIIYGTSLPHNDFFSKAVPYSSNSLSGLSRKSGNFARPVLERQLPQSATTLRLHSRPDGYYAASRMYEEIPPRTPDSAAIFEDVNMLQINQVDREFMRDSVRKPPPTCRPPPPPSQGSPFSTGSSINSIEHELQHIHSSPSPKRSIDDDRKSRHSGENGRESGYGTAPSRLWNSPRLMPRFREIKNRPSGDVASSSRQVPLAVFAQQNNAHSTMTYV